MERFEACEAGGMRLCRLSTSRRTPRAVVAQFGRDGWVLLLKYSVKDILDVVGRTKGKGIVLSADCCWSERLLTQVRGGSGVEELALASSHQEPGEPQRVRYTRLEQET